MKPIILFILLIAGLAIFCFNLAVAISSISISFVNIAGALLGILIIGVAMISLIKDALKY
jgi:hypothetical protein